MTAVAKLPQPKYLARLSKDGEWLELLPADDWTAEMWAHGTEPVYSAEQMRAALSPAELGGMEAAVACHRLCTGDPPSRWMWIDGPASLGAMDQARLHGWRIENAYATPRAAEAVTEYRWRSVSDDLPERTGWYIGINYGVVEPLRWDGNNWHHTRVTRDLAMPSHWRPLPAPPSLTPPSAKGE